MTRSETTVNSSYAIENFVDDPALSVATSPKFADLHKIQVGDEAHFEKTICFEDVDNFAKLTGDSNPLHTDEDFAGRTHYGRRVVHGMLVASYVSTLVGVHCPGAGALWSQQNFQWSAPVFIGDRIHLTLSVTHKSAGSRSLTIAVKGVNQNGKVFMNGEGIVSILEERVRKTEVPLQERTAFITGATQEIGSAIASVMSQAGITVVLNYLEDAQAAEDICASLEAKGGRAIAVQADLTNGDSVKDAVRQAEEKLRRPIDTLVNGGWGFPDVRPFLETTWAEMKSALDSHLGATFNCCQAVIPGMAERKSGRIINIGSAFLRSAPPANWSSFLISKAAVQALTRSLAVELGPLGIRVNMVSPGLLEGTAEVPERLRKVQAMQTPLRRLADADDIARVVLALTSEAGEFITGTDIPVCGGLQM